MNREIKFRAWDSKNEFMFYHDEEGEFERKIDGCRVGSDFNVQDLLFNPYQCLTSMQFTGLKDKNEKDIYEGDVLTYNGITSNGNKIIREVNYNKENARFQSGMYHLTQSIELAEVIGNIYENPELLTTI